MRLLQDILVATDFSKSSDRAIQASVLLAKKFKSRIAIMHVESEENVSEETKILIEQSIHNKLVELKEQISKEGVSVSDILIESGVVFEKIIQVAQARNVNVIVAGSGSKDKNDNFKLGTTVEKLMRKNQIPLWVVKNEDVKPISKITCPVDFSDASRRALLNAITLAEKLNAELSVLHVFIPVVSTSVRISLNIEEENKNLRNEKVKEFDRFLKEIDFKSVKFTKNLLMGMPDIEIFKAIKQQNADLLLMGTTGKNSLSKLLMGSITEKVTRVLPCSFITTKAKDITDGYLESNLKGIESILNPARNAFKKGDYELAIEKFTIGLKQYPDNIPILLELIDSYKALGNNTKVAFYSDYKNEVLKRIWGDHLLNKLKLE
jgi:nucleotide-binding universal stress UspA family protein